MDIKRTLASIKESRPKTTDQVFKWRFNDQDDFIEATHTRLSIREFSPGEAEWVWEGWTGSIGTRDMNYYYFTIPRLNDEPIDRTFEMGKDGLIFAHGKSTAEGEFKLAQAQSAIVHIKLDAISGISQGKFNAEFLGIHASPQGEFSLTREAR